jgi:hypothetical protein
VGCVQARAQWSPGNCTSCEKEFNLSHHTWEDYRGTRFYKQDRVEDDASGLTFQEWTPDVDTSRPPVAMIINSSELRAAGFKLKEVLPLQHLRQLHVVACGHEERDCEVLRAWALKGLFCQ